MLYNFEYTCAHIHIDTHPRASIHTHKYSSGPYGQGGGYRASSFACVSTKIYIHVDFVCASVRVEERTLGLALALGIVRVRCLRRHTFTPSLGNCDKTAVHYLHSSPPACARSASSIYTHIRAASSIFTHIHVNIFPPKKPKNFPSTSRSASHPCLVSINPSSLTPQTLHPPLPPPLTAPDTRRSRWRRARVRSQNPRNSRSSPATAATLAFPRPPPHHFQTHSGSMRASHSAAAARNSQKSVFLYIYHIKSQ
jgi:hypothetical protein